MPEAYRFRRVRRLERMDDAGTPKAERAEALRGLERVGSWWGQRRPLLEALAGLLGDPGPRRRRLMEVGAGSGHLARWLSQELARRGHRVEVTPTDLHPVPGVRRLDALSRRLPEADIYFSNLFLHHLPDDALPGLFAAQARASRLGFAHYDLQRHWAHFYGAALCLKMAGLPAINQFDGLSSIQQGYTRAELLALAAQGVRGADLGWKAPFRWMLTWKKG